MENCYECKKPILGRSDKRFCSSYCRSSWHNKKYQIDRRNVRRINTILRKNRQILLSLLEESHSKVTSQYLLELGFNFGFYTSIDLQGEPDECRYCYDVGYLKNNTNTFKIKLKS